MSKFFKSIFIGAGLVICCIGFVSYQFMSPVDSKNSSEILFDVMPGQSMALVASRLEAENLIQNSWVFVKCAQLIGLRSQLKKGEYSLNKSMSPIEIVKKITSGKSVLRKLTIPEGKNIFEIAEILEKNNYGIQSDFLKLVTDKDFIESLTGEKLDSLEGYLFPDTYKVSKFDSQKEIIQQMLNRFNTVYKEFELSVKKTGWTKNKFITFSSLIEKETGAKADRSLVSSVFHNRLKINMKLQTDPTVLYGKAMLLGSMPNNITRADLMLPTKYNSYTNYGLPPTPISNPGKDSMMAALNPTMTKYIYFVSRNDGTTAFSETLDKHNLAVQKFQINTSHRKGKSWRDLNK